MSLSRLDVRFLLPRLPGTAIVIGSLGEWEVGLRETGVVVPSVGEPPDLVVTTAELLDEAASMSAPAVIVDGHRGAKRLSADGYSCQRFLPVPSFAAPEMLIPLEQPAPATYALRHLAGESSLRNMARNRVLSTRAAHWVIPGLRPLVTVLLRDPAPPALVAAACRLGIPSNVGWFVTLGKGDALTRGAFHLFPPDSDDPAWVVKYARVAGYREPFDRDATALGLVTEAGGPVAARAPRLMGQIEADGIHASVETAAIGCQLGGFLSSARSNAAKLGVIESVASWLVDVARATAAPTDQLDSERQRLRAQVLPEWDVDPLILRATEGLPAVFQHNDLGTWNLMVGPHGFTAIDWESARRHGLPLWDLLYFLTDALALLGGESTADGRAGYALRLLRGDLPASRTLFRWLRRGAEAMAIPVDAVGPLATLCWLHHGLSHRSRWRTAAGHAAADRCWLPPVERVAQHWLSDPALGPTWSAWARA